MQISCISADISKAGSFGLDRIERGVGEDIERAAIGSPEYEIDGALWNIDSAQQFSFGGVDEDLPGGEVDIAGAILGDGFAAIFGEEL